MAMVVRSNIMALNANRQLGMNNSAVSKNLEKLSSGFKINRAGDDASGLAISEKMKAQIKGLETASANSQDGISLVQTAEGALTEVHDMLNRMVELATKSANGTIQDEVDRDAIQSEVNALNEEIDRISQSTNFNGINLLDGSLGLNHKAITVGQSLAATGLQTGATIDLASKLSAANAAGTHLSTKSVTGVSAGFSIDLGDLEIDLTALANTTGATFTVTFAGVGVTFTAATGATTYTAGDIADLIVAAFNSTSTAGASAGVIGDMKFTAAVGAGGKINFTYAGMNANGTAAANTDTFTQAEADAINALLAGGVTYAADGGNHADTVVTGDILHNNLDVTQAVVKKDAVRAGIDLDISSVLRDGNELTIDGKTFIFKTDAGSSVTGGGGKTLIDVSAKTGVTAQLAEAVALLSNETSTNFNIEAKDGKTIHIDQKVGNTEEYETYDSLKALFSAKGPDSAAANANTKVTFDPTKLREGNSVVINNKTYTFGSGSGQIALGANGSTALSGLQTALAADGLAATISGNDLTIFAAGANDKAPVVGGEGLTLQIGDTGDSFNMVRVRVADMSAGGLGVRNLDVSNADTSRAAIATIKTAINKVSTNRADMGALQNRLEHTINNLDVAAENMSAANSRVRDTDMAKQMMEYTKMNVLTQAAQAMLAQANQQPQSILQLLQ